MKNLWECGGKTFLPYVHNHSQPHVSGTEFGFEVQELWEQGHRQIVDAKLPCVFKRSKGRAFSGTGQARYNYNLCSFHGGATHDRGRTDHHDPKTSRVWINMVGCCPARTLNNRGHFLK